MAAPIGGAGRRKRNVKGDDAKGTTPGADRAEKVEHALMMLDEGVGRITGGEEFRRYLAFSARFHRYSARNCLLILAQCPHASRVAGYRKWQELGRQVRRGEEGIRILAPVSRTVEEEGTDEKVRALVGFRVTTVFDVSQTDGEPLPEAPVPEDLRDSDDPAGVASRVYEGLSRFCQDEGVAVETEDRRPGEYGSYDPKGRRVVLNRALSEVDRATTLTHELVHHLLHREDDSRTTRAMRETEAEGTSFAVFSYFGFDTSVFTFAYVARYAKETEILKAALSRIQKATHELIEAVERGPSGDLPEAGGRAS